MRSTQPWGRCSASKFGRAIIVAPLTPRAECDPLCDCGWGMRTHSKPSSRTSEMNSLLSEMSAGAAQVASQLGLVGLSETDIARAWKYSMADTCGHTLHVGDTLHYCLGPHRTSALTMQANSANIWRSLLRVTRLHRFLNPFPLSTLSRIAYQRNGA